MSHSFIGIHHLTTRYHVPWAKSEYCLQDNKGKSDSTVGKQLTPVIEIAFYILKVLRNMRWLMLLNWSGKYVQEYPTQDSVSFFKSNLWDSLSCKYQTQPCVPLFYQQYVITYKMCKLPGHLRMTPGKKYNFLW